MHSHKFYEAVWVPILHQTAVIWRSNEIFN